MSPWQSIPLLLSLCAASAYLNQKTVRWPPVLAMSLMSIVLAVVLIAAGHSGWVSLPEVEAFIRSFDFPALVLHGLLGPLLFAGALFVDVDQMRKWFRPIGSLVTVGVLISAFVVAVLLWLLAPVLGSHPPFLWCLLFGALIAPTDPIAALSIVRGAGAPKHLEVKLVGESLFNDGTGVMLFLIVLAFVQTGDASPGLLFWEILIAPLGGGLVGWGLGVAATHAIARVDHHPTEILLTLALATGVYSLAETIHLSAPIAVVTAGLVIGHKARRTLMSEKTREHLDAFWESADEILNAILFGLIGLELILIEINLKVVLLGILAWVLVLVGRWAGVVGALLPIQKSNRLGGRGTTWVLVWGGLRGGISLALALSLPADPSTRVLVAVTFIVVGMSSIFQGLTLARVLPKA